MDDRKKITYHKVILIILLITAVLIMPLHAQDNVSKTRLPEHMIWGGIAGLAIGTLISNGSLVTVFLCCAGGAYGAHLLSQKQKKPLESQDIVSPPPQEIIPVQPEVVPSPNG